MKRTAIILVCAMLLPIGAIAKKEKAGSIRTYKDCYIYGQSGRNTAKKGSALDLTSGITYSMQNAVDQAGGDIDVMLFFGKANKDKFKNFYLFAPNNPNITINWEKEGGTTPFCKFEGKSDNPNSYFALKNWNTRKATKLEKVSDVDFDGATYESIDAINIEDSYIASDIKVGDIIAFQLEGKKSKPGKKGLIKITALEDDEEKPAEKGRGEYQRFILTVKIQK